MKHLIYFLLFSTAAFSQNYQYAIEVVPKKTLGSPTGLTISQVTETSVDLIWVAPVPATSIKDYEIYNKNVLLAKSTGTATNYQLKELNSDTSYSLTVRAVYSEGNISGDSNVQEFKTLAMTTGVSNQLEEIEYFKAYLLPITQKATIQQALDKYGSVRLEKGDYSGVPIVMRSNQRLYGHNTLNPVSRITIAAGSANVHLESLNIDGVDRGLEFQAGNPITNCVIKTTRYGTITAIGAKLENNLFINILSRIHFDFSATGYYRNNKFIKQQSGIVSPIVLIKGNSTTPSNGNVHFWTNLLTPWGDGMVLDNLGDTTFIGVDAEGWNGTGSSVGNKAAVYARNMSNFKLAEVGGANGYSPDPKTPGFDIDASNLLLIHNAIGSDAKSLVFPRTNLVNVGGYEDILRHTGTVIGYDITAQQYHKPENTQDVLYNGVVQTTITNPTTINTIKNAFLGTKLTPWAKPNWETLPDPLGANWRDERVGKLDSRDYIQNLINTKGIAELPEGVFYIGSTLNVSGQNQGIIGSGTGKTVICGLTDDFPLITMVSFVNGINYHLSNLTLQGGSVGQFFPENYVGTAYLNTKFVVYRDQKIGIHYYKMGGTDNCFFDNISFVNCGVGIMQEPKIITDDVNISGYIDKVVYYKGQYLNCGIGTSNHAMRGNNLNSWVDCKYDGNGIAYSNGSNNFSIMANCDFTNNKGNYTVQGGDLSLYSCNFYNNKPLIASTNLVNIYAEGCNFLDSVQFARVVPNNDNGAIVINSTIIGDVITKNRADNKKDNSLFVNTALPFHPTLSKFMMKVTNGKPSVVIESEPNPYPQFLVTQ